MKIKLKTLFLLGYLLMGAIVLLLGFTGIYFIERLSNTPDKILKDNYGSIIAAQNMIDELDNMDNAIITYVSGKPDKNMADSLFTSARDKYFLNLKKCESNITEPGETELTADIRKKTEHYIRSYEQNRTSLNNILAYDSVISPQYTLLKKSCYELLNLNHKGMLNRRDETVKISESAELYMMVISALSLIIVLIAILKVPSLIVNPVNEFTRKVEAIAEKRYSERVEINSGNELGKLALSFNNMASKLEEYEKSNIEMLIAEKKRAEAIVKSMIDGIIVLNENYDVILVNNIGTELLGISESALLGKNMLEVSHTNSLVKNITDDFAGHDKEKGNLNYIRIVFREREEYFLKEILNVTDENNPQKTLGYIIILKNVTGFKELDELKSGFVATVSHELRTPLSAMNMSLRLLQDERIGGMNDEQKRITSAMKDEVKRLLKLVNELLDLSRIESGSEILKYREVKADELVDAAITPMLLQFEQKNIELVTEIEPDLPGLKVDANKIAWVMINLLNNAVRYSADGGEIVLKVHKDTGKVIFSVKDHGSGIEPQYLSRIFEKFVQVKSRNIESINKGVGLGLAISKEFVNAHGGDIWVKSEIGKGSEFSFSIPVN
ncbi:MAG TPA: ATP-binding protein [Ignavibacteria bacterium]|nr:ATP-binding protein [Ignavibacteria bacterium]HMR00619.1 ATP-binding protein [Ignavibacteria bacterium]